MESSATTRPASRSVAPVVPPEMIQAIETLLSANCRRYIGRGPSKISVKAIGDLIIVKSEGVLTPMEATFAQYPMVRPLIGSLRKKALRLSLPDWQSEFRRLFNLEILELQGEWDVANDRDSLIIRVARV